MNISQIESNLTTKVLGRSIKYADTTESTNTLAKQFADSGEKDGTLIICGTQTNGRGRRGRSWQADESTLCMSVILRPDVSSQLLPRFTIACAVAVNAMLRKLGIESLIKWPNDIHINGKKLCGILFDGSFLGNECQYIICGIGINVTDVSDNEEIKKIATSIVDETHIKYSREEICALTLNELENVFSLCAGSDFDKVMTEYCKYSAVLGKKVIIKSSTEITGIVTGFDDLGRIEILSNNGKYLIDSADVSLYC